MVDAFTGTAAMANLVQTAYDRLVAMKLRNAPVHRSIADVRPRQVPMPGSAVVMQIHGELAPATTPLTETVDVDAVAIPNPTTVTISPAEYGNAALVTRKLSLFALSDVDPAVADEIAWNIVNSMDRVFRDEARQGTNVTYASTAVSTVTVTNAMIITSAKVREIIARLRGFAAIPRKGELYGAYVHPFVSADLRSETGVAAWRDPHVYSAPGSIWAGEIGGYEGAFWIETNRAYSANDGEPTPNPDVGVFRTLFFGKQFLSQAVWDEPHVVIGNVVDKLKRFRPIGWTGTLGTKRYRENCGWRFESASTLVPSGATVPSDQP